LRRAVTGLVLCMRATVYDATAESHR